MIGTTVGSYRITEEVSVGGMGTVYRAEHVLLGKSAAVKILHPELRHNREAVSRFFNEAKTTTQIKHPGIVEVFDFGHLPSGDGYLVMEFLDGASLAHVVREGRMPERRAVTLLRGVCNALAAAHALGVIHRDLKPDNIFVCPDADAPTGERTKILDFGIAKLGTGSATGPSSATKTGIVMGTPRYMSPEQCKGAGAVDHRADLYSIGCIMYELLCGTPPFVAEGAGELIAMHLFVQPEAPRSREPSISEEADELIRSLLEKDPAKRPQTAAELAQRFTALARTFGVTALTPPAGIPIRPSLVVEIPTTPPIAVPTTLSGAARQTTGGKPRSRKSILFVASGVVVAAGLSIAFALHGGNTPAPAAAPVRAAQPMPQPQPPPPPPVAPPIAPPPAPTVAPPPVVTPPSVTVKHRPPPVVKHAPPKDHPAGAKDPEPASGSAAPHVLIEKDL